jgi:hypothetical protein
MAARLSAHRPAGRDLAICRKGHGRSQGAGGAGCAAGHRCRRISRAASSRLARRRPAADSGEAAAARRAGPHVWVTRSRPKIDRIACPWLIRRFVDPRRCSCSSRPPRSAGVAERLGATPFDIEGVFWSHRGELCTFDTMLASSA